MGSRRSKVSRLYQWNWVGTIKKTGERQRCDAPLKPEASGFRYSRTEKGIMICNRYASYKINKRLMCRKHAALFVLDELDPEGT